MAFTISDAKKISLGGFTPGLALVYGTGTAESVTSGVVPGSTYGVRKILLVGKPNLISGTGVTTAVKSYDATTYDSDIITYTCSSGDVFQWWFIGEDNGEV